MNENLNTKRRSPDVVAAVWAGLIAGLIMMVLQLVMVPAFLDRSAWAPTSMTAAILMGRDALPGEGATAAGWIVVLALVVHYALSVLYALAGSTVLARLRFWPAVITGAVGGFVLYLINFYAFTAAFDWFVAARNWVTTFTHIAFGIGVAAAYKGLERPEPLASQAPMASARAS
jgi:hypothetical protein